MHEYEFLNNKDGLIRVIRNCAVKMMNTAISMKEKWGKNNWIDLSSDNQAKPNQRRPGHG